MEGPTLLHWAHTFRQLLYMEYKIQAIEEQIDTSLVWETILLLEATSHTIIMHLQIKTKWTILTMASNSSIIPNPMLALKDPDILTRNPMERLRKMRDSTLKIPLQKMTNRRMSIWNHPKMPKVWINWIKEFRAASAILRSSVST